MSKYSDYSKYWLELDDFDATPSYGKDPIKLNAYRNAISNFVRIVTGRSDINVKFAGKESYTDGKSVVIGTNLNDKDFDPAVGLALHEGSHIKLTDFQLLQKLEEWIARHDIEVVTYTAKYGLEDRWVAPRHMMDKLKDLLNIVEDRRIDNFVYTSAPGYQGYYQALYDKYFNAKIIDKGLQSSEYRDLDWESYMFRVINITNACRDLDALPGLRDIWKVLDLKNISRLESTADALEVAWKIFCIIEDNVEIPQADTEDGQSNTNRSDNEDADGTPMQGSSGDSDDDSNENADDTETLDLDSADTSVSYDELTDVQKAKLNKAINEQKSFLDGDIKKSKASKTLENMLKAMESAGVTEEEIKVDGVYNKIPVTVIRDFNMNLVNNIDCDMWVGSNTWNKKWLESQHELVAKGLLLGTSLGKKLKVRAEERNTKFNRQYSGKLDKRMIASCGYGMEAIFERIESFSYTPGTIHISIDNSGSMSGRKFDRSIVTAVAIAKACTMIENLDCQISFRATGSFGTSRRSGAIMLIAYDSRKHGLAQIRQVLPHVCVAGSTPEGLCFDAYMKEILKDSRGKDAYFLNFSDGEPNCDNYYGTVAYRHTRAQVNKMKTEGIKVISYFITSGSSHSLTNFQYMYGRDAQLINVENMNEVAKSINRKFLEVSAE